MVARELSAARLNVVGERGDLAAAPGSRPWAIAVRIELQATLANVQGNAEHLAWMYRAMTKHAGYRQLADASGRPFRTLRAFCLERAPYGLGLPPELIEHIIAERKTAQDRAQQPKLLLDGPGPMTQEETKANPYDMSNRVARYGTCADYLTARIARDRPDILARMQAGEFKSVRAAALEAGLVTPEIHLPLEPRRAATLLCKHFDAAQRDELIAWLLQARARERDDGAD